METIAHMTLEDLRRLIDQMLDHRLKQLLGDFEVSEEELLIAEEPDTRPLEEVYASIDRNMWTPPPGAKSSLQLLREDRES